MVNTSIEYITVKDITVSVIGGDHLRDNVKGGALTETTFYILLSLYKPNHGYGIMQFIENETNGRVFLGAGTLYGAISTLEKKGWITLCKEEDEKSRKKVYIITEAGKSVAYKEIERLQELLNSATKIVEEGKNINEKV
jgi:DNA-binding PadR family transcriptional regulator